jgi:hypothetical protein
MKKRFLILLILFLLVISSPFITRTYVDYKLSKLTAIELTDKMFAEKILFIGGHAGHVKYLYQDENYFVFSIKNGFLIEKEKFKVNKKFISLNNIEKLEELDQPIVFWWGANCVNSIVFYNNIDFKEDRLKTLADEYLNINNTKYKTKAEQNKICPVDNFIFNH